MISTIFILISIVLFLNFVASLIFFIKDGIEAKKEGRKRKAGFTAWFVVAATIFGLEVIVVLTAYLLVWAFLASM